MKHLSILIIIAFLALSSCSNNADSSRDRAIVFVPQELCLGLISGMTSDQTQQLLDKEVYSKKAVKHDDGKVFYAMDVEGGEGYLFQVEPSYYEGKLYDVSLFYFGTFHRMIYRDIENIVEESTRDKNPNEKATTSVLTDCKKILSSIYGLPTNEVKYEDSNVTNWLSDNKSTILSANGYNDPHKKLTKHKRVKDEITLEDFGLKPEHDPIVGYYSLSIRYYANDLYSYYMAREQEANKSDSLKQGIRTRQTGKDL